MMLFAISDAVWLAVIGILYMAVKEYFDRVRARDVREHVIRAEQKIDEKGREQSQKLDTVVENVKVIEKATNSMKDALVLATEKEGLERGAREERERSSRSIKNEGPSQKSTTISDLKKDIERVPEKTADEIEKRENEK